MPAVARATPTGARRHRMPLFDGTSHFPLSPTPPKSAAHNTVAFQTRGASSMRAPCFPPTFALMSPVSSCSSLASAPPPWFVCSL
jgi:hypothetical protein